MTAKSWKTQVYEKWKNDAQKSTRETSVLMCETNLALLMSTRARPDMTIALRSSSKSISGRRQSAMRSPS